MSNQTDMKRTAWIGGAFVTLTLSLAACGGGGSSSTASTGSSPPAAAATGDSPAAATSPVPDSASASVAGFADFQQTLKRDDIAEPIQIGAFRPPKDDTAEPTPLK